MERGFTRENEAIMHAIIAPFAGVVLMGGVISAAAD
jgi:hypothetical protein